MKQLEVARFQCVAVQYFTWKTGEHDASIVGIFEVRAPVEALLLELGQIRKDMPTHHNVNARGSQ